MRVEFQAGENRCMLECPPAIMAELGAVLKRASSLLSENEKKDEYQLCSNIWKAILKQICADADKLKTNQHTDYLVRENDACVKTYLHQTYKYFQSKIENALVEELQQ